MSYDQASSVVVSLPSGDFQEYPWATSVQVDRKGTLHVYGPRRQHIVHLEGEWVRYGVNAPASQRTVVIVTEEGKDARS